MLPLLSNLKTSLIAGSVALALVATSAAPALAWSRDDKMFARGVAATLLLGYLITSNNRAHAQPVPQYQPQYQPQYRPVYRGDDDQRDDRGDQYGQYPRHPVYVPAPQPSIYYTPAAYAFSTYSMNERRRIQATLTNYGYYHGYLDGNFGPGTYDAIARYARNTGRLQYLGSQAGSVEIFNGLLS